MTPEAWMMFLHNMMSLAFCFFQRQLHLYIEWLNEGSLLLRLQQQSHLDFNDVTAQLEGSLPSVSFSNNVAWICWPSLTPTICTALKERSRRWSTLQPACIRVKHPPLSSVKVKYTNSDFPNTLLRVGNRLFFFFLGRKCFASNWEPFVVQVIIQSKNLKHSFVSFYLLIWCGVWISGWALRIKVIKTGCC